MLSNWKESNQEAYEMYGSWVRDNHGKPPDRGTHPSELPFLRYVMWYWVRGYQEWVD